MLSVVTALLVSLLVVNAAAVPRFVPEETSAVVSDGVVEVSFTEAGLTPGQRVLIEVAVDATSISECRTRDPVEEPLLTSTSTASAHQASDHLADADGLLSGAARLTVRPGTLEVEGMGCTVHVTTHVVVHLLDRTNGLTHEIEVGDRAGA